MNLFNKSKYIAIVACASTMMVSCDDFLLGNALLEKPISDEMTIDSVYAHKKYAEQALAQVYHSLPDFGTRNNFLGWSVAESITDLGDSFKSGGTPYHKGSFTAAASHDSFYSLDYKDGDGSGSATYGIRQAHLFIENVGRVPDMTDEEKRHRKGEAKMIIAFHYIQMFRAMGGMPWIDHAYKPSESMKFTRMTVDEAVTNISTLLDEAAELLPWSVAAEDDGRMTAAAAMSLKTRLYLFAASPLFNADEPFLDGEAAQKRYVWYGNYDQNRWKKVSDAGVAFLQENERNGDFYRLVETDRNNPRQDYMDGYFNRYNKEVLVAGHRYVKHSKHCFAYAQIRYGGSAPTLNYVDMFGMKDGSDFDWNNSEHRAHPFFDAKGNLVRDPRLYENVTVNEDKFDLRKAEIYIGGREYAKTAGAAAPGRFYAGFGVRKLCLDIAREVDGKFYQCPLFRLSEVYLSMAEAMNELGKANVKDALGNDAYDYINMVRNRVDMPNLDKSKYPEGVALREAILKERALEFGYEEIRIYDINRWKHKDYLDVPLKRLVTTKQKNGTFTYEVKVGGMKNQRNWVTRWSDKYYLVPLPLAEINKKYGLIQNPGWE